MQDIKYDQIRCVLTCPMRFYWRYVENLVPHHRSQTAILKEQVVRAFHMKMAGFTLDDITKQMIATFDEMIASAPLPDKEDFTISKWTALGMWANNQFAFKDTVAIKNNNIVYGSILHETPRSVQEVVLSSLLFDDFKAISSYHDRITATLYENRGKTYECFYIRRPLLRKRQSEDGFEFAHRVAYDYKVRPQDYYQTFTFTRSREDFDRWIETTIFAVHMIGRIRDGSTCYRNTDACYFARNKFCPYLKICFKKDNAMEKDLYFKKEEQDGR